MENAKPKIIFVYNADKGLFNTVTDYIHKIASSNTYPCKLCTFTFGNVGMKQEWKKFIASLNRPVEFLHRDEFLTRYNLKNTKFPAVFVKKAKDVESLISRNEINSCKSIEDLKNLVANKLKR